jgi:hypothetical protein
MKRTVGSLLLIGGLLLAPAAAQASIPPSLSTVLIHTHAAEVAKTRAVAEFEAHAFAKGKADFSKNRAQMGQAISQSARLIKDASTPAARLAAAKAVVAVAQQAGRDETAFARALRALTRGSQLQAAVAAAVRKDAGRIATALARLHQLATTLPASAQQGIATAIARLSISRGPAIAQEAADVTANTVGMTAKQTVAAAIAADIHGRQLAINLLQAIQPLLPQHAQQGITTALQAIGKALANQAARLTTAKSHAPQSVRPALTKAIHMAKAAARDALSP